MKWQLVEDYAELSALAAERWLSAVAENSTLVLGLPTGRTPEGLYETIVRQCREARSRPRSARPCFEGLTTFNLDEYVGLPPEHPGSYRSYMQRHLFDHIDIAADNAHVPDGTARGILAEHADLDLDEALSRECLRYEAEIAQAGSLGLTFLGLGTNGHIGFNEPAAAFSSRTRIVGLTESTRQGNAAEFAGGAVPHQAITIGIATILESDSIVLLASGVRKAEAVRRLASGPIDPEFPASALKLHPDVTVIVDRAASTLL